MLFKDGYICGLGPKVWQMNKTKLKLLVSLPLPVTGKVIPLGTAELFFSETSRIIPGFKYALDPGSYRQKRGVSLEIGRQWLQH